MTGRETQAQASRGVTASVFTLENPNIFREVQTILLERETLEDESDHVERGHVEENQSTPAVPAIPAEAPDM